MWGGYCLRKETEFVDLDTSPLFDFLSEHGIAYQRCDHPPVYTVEEAARLVPPLPGAKTKNLFLRDKPGRRHLLVCVPAAKQVDLKALSDVAGAARWAAGGDDEVVAAGAPLGEQLARGGRKRLIAAQ